MPLAAQTTAEVSAADLRHRVGILADDSMGGRRVGTPGIDRAARYLVRELERLGLRPGAGASYLNPVELEELRAEVSGTVASRGESRTLGPETLVLMSGSSGLPGEPRPAGEGPLRYGGFLVDTASSATALSAEQLAGAVLVLQMSSAANQVGGPRYSVQSLAGPHSPLAALLLVTDDTANWAYLREQAHDGSIEPRRPWARGDGGGPAVFALRAAEAERILGAPLGSAHETVLELGTFSYRAEQSRAAVPASNVVAILPGRDPALAREYVVLGAHLDHVGVGEPVGGDSIYNGADDDASGSAALLEVAERLASLPEGERPARSVLLVWHTAEEAGLLGSRAFTERATVPRAGMVAMLNLDMVARNHPDSLSVIGSRRLSTALGDLLDRANRTMPRPFALDYALDAPGHPARLYCRSDHYSYARFSIPVAFLTGGLHDQYHHPDDEAGTLDYGKLARVTDLVLRATLELAALPRRPAVDRPLPPLGMECS